MRWPTLRTSMSDVPERLVAPSCDVSCRSSAIRRVKVEPSFVTSSVRVERWRPSQFRYASALSSASTHATESSQSMMTVMADSSRTSAMPAESVAPTECSRSMTMCTCRLLWATTMPEGASAMPVQPTTGVVALISCPSLSVTIRVLPSTRYASEPRWLPDSSGTQSSSNLRA